jgi:hypothetical protein
MLQYYIKVGHNSLKIMKLSLYNFLHLPDTSLKHSFLKHPQPMLFPEGEIPSFHNHTKQQLKPLRRATVQLSAHAHRAAAYVILLATVSSARHYKVLERFTPRVEHNTLLNKRVVSATPFLLINNC